jgi:hypothetical protein
MARAVPKSDTPKPKRIGSSAAFRKTAAPARAAKRKAKPTPVKKKMI